MKNISFSFEDNIDDAELNRVEQSHEDIEAEHGIVCNFKKFFISCRDLDNKLIGLLTAYTAFSEIYIEDLWVESDSRKKGIGKALLISLENEFQGKGYNNINLVTSAFQAPEFYKKCGFTEEFIRTNKLNPKLTKHFFIKYFEDKDQYQGILNINQSHN